MARFALGTLIILCGAIASERSEAANWRICNKTAEPMWVAIAYDPGNGRHVSRGWWRLNACAWLRNGRKLQCAWRVVPRSQPRQKPTSGRR
jgi:uncharacterized membrane protein